MNILLELYTTNNFFNDNLDFQSKELILMENTIKSKNKNISNLIASISMTDDEMVIKPIMDKIKALTFELNELQIKLNNLKCSIEKDIDDIDTENIINYLYNFKDFFNNQTIENKISLINSIINIIEWDDIKNELNIIYK